MALPTARVSTLSQHLGHREKSPHEIKTFSDTCTLPLQKNMARGIRRDQGRLKQEVIFLAKEGNSLPHFCIL